MAATIGTSGLVTGIAAGTSVISYVLSTGCSASLVVTVNASPSAISGVPAACVGLTTGLSDVGGGTWLSGTAGIAIIGTDGTVTGIAPGTAVITYTLPTGCVTTRIVTINAVPATINGTLAVCAGSATTLTNAVTGGTWSSSNASIATTGLTSGIVTGVSGGTATITYTAGAGCFAIATLTVNPILPITGALSTCTGSSTTLYDGSPGGTWSSSNPTIAGIGSSSGIVTGNALGTVTISYAISTGCVRTATLTVGSIPGSISGVTLLCAGTTTTLSNTVSGGTWSTSNLGIATAIAATGVITGIAAGTANVTYTQGTGCIAVTTITVNATPSAIGGATAVCVSSSITLSDFVSGGIWTSNNGNASIGSTTGIVTGIAAGLSTITYALAGTGCYKTYYIAINPVPAPISGAATVCVGAVGFESDATPGGISWSSSNTSVATITNSGAITGLADGTTTITYTIATGCIATSVVTVNSFAPAITGNVPVCAGASITLSDALAGGSWVSNNPAIATIGSGTGIVTGVAGGTVLVNYVINGGCAINTVVTVNAILPITGTPSACVGSSVILADGTYGGVWTSSNTGIATVGSSSGVVSGVSSGSAVISYSTTSGCSRTVTVNISPMTVIAGSPTVCVGVSTALTNATAGGIWSSNAPFVASVGATGIVMGEAAGIANITYSVSGCDEVQTVTVNAAPSGIGGTTSVCAGASVTLSNFVAGGTWSSGSINVAVGSATGVVNGVTAGTATVTYMITATGCFKTYSMIVNPVPATVAGATAVCAGSVTFVSDATPGGISWSSSNISVATVVNSGAVTGVAAGTTRLTYTIYTGCFATAVFTVNAVPLVAAISGADHVSSGSTITLSDVTAGGAWSSANNLIASVGTGTGIVTGVGIFGITTITYSVTNATGCIGYATQSMTVHTPAPPSGSGSKVICIGSTTTVDVAVPGGVWTSSNDSVVVVNDGVVTGVSTGNAVVKYTVKDGMETTVVSTHIQVASAPGGTVIRAIPGTSISVGEMLTLMAAVDDSGPSTSYQWFVNGVQVIGAVSDTFSGNAFSDNDSVVCVVTGIGPCGTYVTESSIIINVSTLNSNTKIPKVSEILLLPNPSNGEFTIKGTLGIINNQSVVIEITDMLGQSIYKRTVPATDGTVNEHVSLRGALADGMYMLNLRSGNDSKTLHFVIE